jgi:hypothetical protein
LIEDGSAAGGQERVLGRYLDAPEIRQGAGIVAQDGGAGDLISRFTEAAARELGWDTLGAMRVRLAEHASNERPLGRVALRLPELPSYYSTHMALRAEIDRGDVRRSRARPGDQRPLLTIYVHSEGRDIALVQWNTTIGGWQSEQLRDGGTVRRYKESPTGVRVWQDVVAAPVWFPPPSTPDRELVWQRGGQAHVKWSLFGPGPRSAYGLLMVMHHEPTVSPRTGETRMRDEGIRVHGSSRYGSILTGVSHGCHRLFNHLALRLGAFLVSHRNHQIVGPVRGEYRRHLSVESHSAVEGEEPEVHELSVRLNQRGYVYRLDPPVEVNVLEGRVHGWSR